MHSQSQSQSAYSHDRFASTRWSVVMQQATAGDARDALGELARRYWYPVYGYVRRCGHEPEAAQQIARAFLQNLLRDFQQDQARTPRGHYRNYLLEQLHEFLAAGVRTDESTARLEPPRGLEQRYQHDHRTPSSPDAAYQRSFALEVLSRALRRLHAEAHQAGHQAMFAALERYLVRDPPPGEYEQAAAALGNRPLVLAIALKRLRQRLRELTAEELADTVTTHEDLATEQQTLLEILRERQ